MKYELDDETKMLMEEILSWAQSIIDLQMDQEIQEEMQDCVTTLADRFGIQYSLVNIEETINEKGETVVSLVVDEQLPNPKPHLTVIDGAKDLKD